MRTKLWDIYKTDITQAADNASYHLKSEEVLAEDEFVHHALLLRLSLLAPMFNLIAQTWSVLKAGVRADMTGDLSNILADTQWDRLIQTKYRMQRLENIVRYNINRKIADNCENLIAHKQRFISTYWKWKIWF